VYKRQDSAFAGAKFFAFFRDGEVANAGLIFGRVVIFATAIAKILFIFPIDVEATKFVDLTADAAGGLSKAEERDAVAEGRRGEGAIEDDRVTRITILANGLGERFGVVFIDPNQRELMMVDLSGQNTCLVFEILFASLGTPTAVNGGGDLFAVEVGDAEVATRPFTIRVFATTIVIEVFAKAARAADPRVVITAFEDVIGGGVSDGNVGKTPAGGGAEEGDQGVMTMRHDLDSEFVGNALILVVGVIAKLDELPEIIVAGPFAKEIALTVAFFDLAT